MTEYGLEIGCSSTRIAGAITDNVTLIVTAFCDDIRAEPLTPSNVPMNTQSPK